MIDPERPEGWADADNEPSSMSGAALARAGVIGLGKMGRPIARRLAACGFEVVAYDASVEAQDGSRDDGISLADSAKDVAERSDATLVLVGSDNEVLDTVTEPVSGILAGASAGHVVLIGSTIAPASSIAIGRAATPHRVEVLDAALCRGEMPAGEGALLVLAGGPDHVFQRCRPLLNAIATDVHHLGGLGAGQVAKMINNYLLWLTVVGNLEGLRLAARMGVDQDALRSALLQSSGANWALDTWERSRPMPWAEADMAIVMECADEYRLPMAAAGVVRELIKAIKMEKATLADGGGVAGSMAEMVRALEAGALRASP